MPKLGLTMTDGLISEWCVAEGARFRKNDVLLIIETDKVAHDVEAPADGELKRILVREGETVPVSTELGIWALEGIDQTTAEQTLTAPVVAVTEKFPTAAEPEKQALSAFVRATPLARRMARDQRLALHELNGTGPNGRIVADDIRSIARVAPQSNPAPESEHTRRSTPTAYERSMAESLTAAKRDTPHFYLSIDVEVSTLLAFRRDLNAIPDRPRVSMTHMLVAAIARALRAAPHMNRVWRENEILSYNSIDIGVAVNTDRGLTNPVIADLSRDSLYDIVRKIDEAIARARAGRLKPVDLRGGAITVSNAGMHDVHYMASIIPPGQSAILGVGAVQPCFRPDSNGAPILRHELGLVLSADHRLHTGVRALGFLEELRHVLATPAALILGD